MLDSTPLDSKESAQKNENIQKLLPETEKKCILSSPDDLIVSNVLNYSKALSVKKSDSLGFIESVLN